jgi:PAS domain S-box-containing protein
MNSSNSHINYQQEINELQRRLEEANDIIDAIRTGSVDALIVNGEDGHQLYTLKTADQTYRVFIEKMNEGAVTLNKQGMIVYSNSRFAKMIDLPLAKVIGISFIDLVNNEDRDHFNALIQKGWQSDSKGELFLQRKDGNQLSALVSLTTLELDEGTALSIIIADLSEQKKVQAELKLKNEELENAQYLTAKLNAELENKVQARTQKIQEAEERARVAVESGNMGTFDFNLKTNNLITSPRVCRIFGITNPTNLHTDFTKLIHPHDLVVTENAIDEAKHSGRLACDARITWKDDSLHWIRVQEKYSSTSQVILNNY